MPVGRIPGPITEANDKPLALDVRFWADRAKTVQVSLTDASVWLSETDGDGYLEMTVANDLITLVDNVVQIRVPADQMAVVTEGE